MKKTLKREVAGCCLILLAALGILAALGDLLGYEANNTIAVLNILSLPIMGFVAGMFGLDSYAKQINPPNTPNHWPSDIAPPLYEENPHV